jgi:large subunit ribosomal protein L30e
MADTTELKKLIRDGKTVVGTDVVLKKLKAGLITKVYVASNVAAPTMKELSYLQSLAGFDVENTGLTNEDLGVLCKKPFSISVIGVVKE